MPQILKNAAVLALDRPDSLQAQCGFPTKLGEYLLTENPVVVTKVGDIPLFLKDGETALIAEERDPQDFSSKLIWALQNPEEASKIGKAGALVAMREFNYLNETKNYRRYKKTIVNRIKSLYLELIKIISPVRHARLIGVNLGSNCLIYRSMEWPSEPYLVTIGNNVQLTRGVAIHTHGG